MMSYEQEPDKKYSGDTARTFRKEKDPLYRHFDWESAPPFMQKWNSDPQMKAFAEDVIRYLSFTPTEQRKYLRRNVLMSEYQKHHTFLRNTFPKLNANPTGLTIEQILAQDRHFHRTYVNNNAMARLLASVPGCTRVLDGKKWEIKHHQLTSFEWPKFSITFKNLGVVNVGPEGAKSTGQGWGIQYEIPFTVIDEAANGIYDIDYWHVFYCGERMGIFGDERLCLGGQGEHTYNKGAKNLTGLHNHSGAGSNNLPGSGGGTDEVLTGGKGDFDDTFQTLLTAFFTNSVFAPGGKTVFVSTSGIAAEMITNDSTVGALKTLYQITQDKWFRSGDVDEWWIDNNIEKDTNAVSTQRCMMLRLSPNYIRRTVVYPLQRKALLEKTYSDDVAFAYITGDILQVYDANAIQNTAGDCTSGSAGWHRNGLFMSATTKGQRADAIYA